MVESQVQLYERDFVCWTEQQAAALREAAAAGTNLPLDWENLAEEIDSLGRSTRREFAQPHRHDRRTSAQTRMFARRLAAPRLAGHWDTVARERRNIEDLLADSPSLRNQVAEMTARSLPRTVRLVARHLRDYGEAGRATIARLEAIVYRADQVLGDWYPGDGPDAVPLPASGERDGDRNLPVSRGAF
jgi:hypothetical protein